MLTFAFGGSPLAVFCTEPVQRFTDQRLVPVNPPADLSGEFVEARRADPAGGGLCGGGQRRGDREMIAGMHRDRFIDEPQFARELIELLAHLGQTFVYTRMIVGLLGHIKEAIERGADEPGFGGTAVLGGDCQSRNKILADIDADFPLHGAPRPTTMTAMGSHDRKDHRT